MPIGGGRCVLKGGREPSDGECMATASRSHLVLDAARSERVRASRAEPHPGDVRGQTLRSVLLAADLVGVLSAALIVQLAYGVLSGVSAIAIILCVPLWAVIASPLGLYRLPERRLNHSIADEVGRTVLVATAWSWLLLLALDLTSSEPVETGRLVVLWLTSAATVLSGRALARHLVVGRDWYRQRVLVLGAERDVARVVRRIARHPEYGLEVAGVAKLDPMPRGTRERYDPDLAAQRAADGEANEQSPAPAANLLGRIERLVDELGAHRVIMATAPTDMEERSTLVRGLIGNRIAVDLVSAQPDGWSSTSVLHYVEGLPILTVSPVRPQRVAYAGKRAIDIVIAAGALLALSPLLAYCAIRIKIDSPGPVFFRQKRIGRDGWAFQMLKFRTMVADADRRKPDIDELNMHGDGEYGRMFKIPRDPRITRIGASLRRWSIDELPQLFNVLGGQMSLVGPRPLIPAEAGAVSDHYSERQRLRPGITGPWQVHGRSDIGFDDMVRLDYSYAMNWSLAEDARILIRTVGAVAGGRGAY